MSSAQERLAEIQLKDREEADRREAEVREFAQNFNKRLRKAGLFEGFKLLHHGEELGLLSLASTTAVTRGDVAHWIWLARMFFFRLLPLLIALVSGLALLGWLLA
jgi:hypothetical protein